MDLEHLSGVIMRAREEERYGDVLREGLEELSMSANDAHPESTTPRPRFIPTEQKLLLKDWLSTHKRTLPSPNQMKHLISQTNLTRKQIIEALRSLAQQRGNLSPESKELVWNWLEANNFRKPTPAERDEFVKQTKWSRAQLKKQIEYMRDPPGELTEESKRILSVWLEENDFRLPSAEEREQLQRRTKWNRKQLTFQIENMTSRKKHITDEERNIVKTWLEQNEKRNPTSEERLHLMHETKLNPKQLAKVIWYLRDPPGELTTQAKEYIQEWLVEHSMRKPRIDDMREIQRHTGLNVEQIRTQVRFLLQKRPGKITPETKDKIREWWERQQCRDNTSDDASPTDSIATLCRDTGLNRSQIHTQISMLRKKQTTPLAT